MIHYELMRDQGMARFGKLTSSSSPRSSIH
jgi:hypothetical protein